MAITLNAIRYLFQTQKQKIGLNNRSIECALSRRARIGPHRTQYTYIYKPYRAQHILFLLCIGIVIVI